MIHPREWTHYIRWRLKKILEKIRGQRRFVG